MTTATALIQVSDGKGGRSPNNKKARVTALKSVGLPIVGMVLIVAIWWGAVVVFDIDEFLLPSPADVFESFAANPQYLLEQTWVTLAETVQGFLLAIIIGVPIAMIIAASPLLEQMIYPILLAINAAPKVAIAPLLVVWMGFGQTPKVVMVVLLCFFPIPTCQG